MLYQDGWPSYFILGPETSWGVATAAIRTTVYEFIDSTLAGASDPINTARFRGNPSPTRQMLGKERAGGDLRLHLHAEDMLIFLQHLMMDSAIASVDAVAQEVYGDGAGAGKAYATPVTLDTQPTATSPASDPGKLIVTFAGVQTGTVAITGTDQNDTAITETLTFAGDTTKTTTYYFKSVDAAGVVLTGITTGTLLITCDMNTWTHTIALGDAVEAGVTIEEVKGAIPTTYLGCLFNSGTLDMGETVTLALNIIANRANFRENIAGGASPTGIGAYSNMSEEIYPGWGMALQLDAVQTGVENCSLTINNNLSYRSRNKAVRQDGKPGRSDREIILTAGVDYDTTNANFDLTYESDQVIAAILSGIHTPFAGPEYSITITMPRCQLQQHPDPPINDKADILQTLSLRPIRSVADTSSDEILIAVVSTETGV